MPFLLKLRVKGFVVVTIPLILFFTFSSLYFNKSISSNYSKRIDFTTVEESENLLLLYMKEENLNHEFGSQQFIELLVYIATENDEELLKHPNYRILAAYASLYLSEFDSRSHENMNTFTLDNSLLNKTYKQVRESKR